MNNKIKLLIGAVVLVILLAGGSILYRNLSAEYQPDTVMEETNQDTSEAESETERDDVSEEESAREAAPDFTAEDSEGNTVALSDLRGKPVVLNFWASWCGPCQQEMPDFQEAFAEYGGEVQFMMLNLTGSNETRESAEAFIAENKYTFPVYFDVQQSGANAYTVFSIPTTYFIDKDGNIATYAQGKLDMESLQKGFDMIR
ncbi:MAG: TlpA family protein disulfide reductase [Lachnospiraceae bacterium]